jgi:hypothetical protein
MMRTALITFCAVSALLAGCDEGSGITTSRTSAGGDGYTVLRVVDTLQCPDTLGALTRKGSAQAGGTVCTYGGPRGAEVSLHLVSLDSTTPDVALARFENELIAGMPATAAKIRGAAADADAAQANAGVARADAEMARAESSAQSGDRATVRLPGVTVESSGEDASVRIPGMAVDTNGDKARVRIGGFSIDASEGSQAVAISSSDESVSIQAHDDAAEIRTRAPGSSTRVTYILTDNSASEAGWRLVGYEARGPQGGPIVVATVRAKDRNNDGVFDDAKDLVSLNVGE